MVYNNIKMTKMMRKQKIYLETTMFNRYFEHERDYYADTKKLFDEIALGKHEAYTSAYVIEELMKASEPKRDDMLSLLKKYDIVILEQSEETELLAQVYVKNGVIPENYIYDGYHIACASVNGLEVIISLNFQHINKLKTKTMTELINRMNGYNSVYICSPMEVVENE